MRYADWTDCEWKRLIDLCRRDGVTLPEPEIRRAAFGYMQCGADGGGNQHGLAGTVIALNVDQVMREASD